MTNYYILFLSVLENFVDSTPGKPTIDTLLETNRYFQQWDAKLDCPYTNIKVDTQSSIPLLTSCFKFS